jgi:hypothetical protein
MGIYSTWLVPCKYSQLSLSLLPSITCTTGEALANDNTVRAISSHVEFNALAESDPLTKSSKNVTVRMQ